MVSTLDIKRFCAVSSVLHMHGGCCVAAYSGDMGCLAGVWGGVAMHTVLAPYLFHIAGVAYIGYGLRCMHHVQLSAS